MKVSAYIGAYYYCRIETDTNALLVLSRFSGDCERAFDGSAQAIEEGLK